MTAGNLTWPGGLIESLARGECVLFLGAGFTRNALSPSGVQPVSWGGLLTRLLDEIAPRGASGRRSAAVSAIAGQIKNGDLLWAAQAVEALYEEAGRQVDFRDVIAAAVDGPRRNEFEPGKAHQHLLGLDARTIFTTNYDKVLERLFGAGYKYLSYKDDNVAETVRAGRPVVVKIHGTIDNAQGMILTRMNFAELRNSGEQALRVLEALTLTRPVLFLGYGLDDPDLHLILENQMRASGATPGHYLLAHSKSVTDSRRAVMSKAFGVEVLRYEGEHQAGFISALEGLVQQVEAQRASLVGA